MSEVRIHITHSTAEAAAQIAVATHRSMGRVVEDAINEILDRHEEAASTGPLFDVGLLEIVVEHPFLVAMYDGRFAAVGVDIHETGKASTWDDCRGGERQVELLGRPPLMSWCGWFLDMCRRSGMELCRS